MSDTDIQKLAAKSNGVIRDMTAEGMPVKWDHIYVAGDKPYCVYNAPNEQAIREHARRGGFPAEKISQVSRVIYLSFAPT
jgi:hypothetical protein